MSRTLKLYLYEDIFGPQEVQINESPENLKDNVSNAEKQEAQPTPEALAWDESFQNNADPSGRAAGVHNDAYTGKK